VTEDFSKAPPTISEARAKRSGNAEDWTPRDVLVHVLRQIDSGELVLDDVIVISVRAYPDGDDQIVINSNTPTRTRQAGVVARAASIISRD
jgi:hypothetical protein